MAKKNQELAGMEGPGVGSVSIKEIDAAADTYVKIRDKRCMMTPREITAKQNLMDVIHKNEDKIGKDTTGRIVYRYDDMVITLTPGKEQLKVKAASSDGSGDDD